MLLIRLNMKRKRFDEANADLTDNYIKVNKIMAFIMPSINDGYESYLIAILWFGGIRINNGNMDLGSLAAFTQYAMQIMFSLLMVAYDVYFGSSCTSCSSEN